MSIEIDDFDKEESIVWVRGGPDDYPYLREQSVLLTRRRGGLKSKFVGGLVAYADLKRNTPSQNGGLYNRRAWWFWPHDPYPALWENRWRWQRGNVPSEGVKPHSIHTGLPSVPGREDAEQWEAV